MSRFHSYINSATDILTQYKGEEPLASFLKKYFAANKKFGSNDRKQVSHLCYSFFRLGKMNSELPTDERLLLGLFLCSDGPNEILEDLRPEWNRETGKTIEEKCASLNGFRTGHDCLLQNIFPWKEALSNGIDHEEFCRSFLVQPDVFLRLRPGGYGAWAKDKLSKHSIPFREVGETSMALRAGSKIDDIIALDYEAMVQDLNSQNTGEFFNYAIARAPLPFIAAWDCCAGSGGKSLMLFDMHEQLELVATDIRESIIRNLKKRFDTHGLKNYQALVADVSKPLPRNIAQSKFNIVVCDAPCTGSGTWSRTPEQLYYFDEAAIAEFSDLQRRIVSNVITAIQPGGFFVYITCSVFRKENEEIVEFIRVNSPLQLIKMEVLKGYDKKADTMFVALLQKPS